ncbi:hypothetical protein IVA87_25840 [Bradyrhizobium sp. 147]|uniref:hypothetical protein n=1 Tax=unclassified Bradyrhizobium TaxID=2631580 RepID=UPI001FF77694|nr:MULTISPECIES: hypothetical protein [unclassified Bradyrhizobium]MCK1540902.1 hypothetical protein [Bradyrhizobium sp. 179]MCK1682741.1 hypothetical protein [Bradyrhizobium sp. 147]
MIRSRPSKYAPVKALAKVQACIVQLQHETALRTANVSIMFPANSTFSAAGSVHPGIGHRMNNVTSSPRR